MRSPRLRLAAIVAGAALVTTGCGGGAASSPPVASLGNTSGSGGGSPAASSGSSASAAPKGDATQQLDEWAACMRSHGDPTQADPTIDANKIIHITMPQGFPGGVYGQNGHGTGPGLHCAAYLHAAVAALTVGQPAQQSYSQAELLRYSECMRANGVANYPDPVGGNLALNRAVFTPAVVTGPAFQRATTVCAQRTGVHLGFGGTPPPGTIESNVGMFAPLGNPNG